MSKERPKPKVLLTGKTGQVGRELAHLLGRMGELTALDRAQLDLGKPDEIRRVIRGALPDVIVNAAAYTAVDRAESDEAAARAINAAAPRVMAEEAKRLGRKPDAVRISNFVFMTVISESKEASRKTVEMMAPMFQQTPEQLLASPLMLIGTPEECIAELKRRAKDWGTSQVIFTGEVGQNEKQMRDLREKVLVHV